MLTAKVSSVNMVIDPMNDGVTELLCLYQSPQWHPWESNLSVIAHCTKEDADEQRNVQSTEPGAGKLTPVRKKMRGTGQMLHPKLNAAL